MTTIEKMNTNRKTIEKDEMEVKFSTFWIFSTLNYLYADVFTSFFNPAVAEEARWC